MSDHVVTSSCILYNQLKRPLRLNRPANYYPTPSLSSSSSVDSQSVSTSGSTVQVTSSVPTFHPYLRNQCTKLLDYLCFSCFFFIVSIVRC